MEAKRFPRLLITQAVALRQRALRACVFKRELFQLHFLVLQGCLKRPRKDVPLLVFTGIGWIKLGKLFNAGGKSRGFPRSAFDHRT